MSYHRAVALSMLLGLSTAGMAQDKNAEKSPAEGEKTVIGCLTGSEGQYTVGTSNDMLYVLEGDTDSFKRLNGKMVKIAGTMSDPRSGTSKDNVLSQQPPTIKVTALKKMADSCN